MAHTSLDRTTYVRSKKREIIGTSIKDEVTLLYGILDALRALRLLNLYISLTLLSLYTISVLLGQRKWLSISKGL